MTSYWKRLERQRRSDLIILDDISHARRDHTGTSVLFEQIGERYEHKRILITAHTTFSAWDQIFPEMAMTVAAEDRLAHHSTSLEMNAYSSRGCAA